MPTDARYEALMAERNRLVTQQFLAGLTAAETQRLTRIRRILDRLEMRRFGPIMDRLDAAIAKVREQED